MIGVRLPPIEAGKVAEGRSRFNARPCPLKSIPAYGDLRMTGFWAAVIFAAQMESLPGVP